jgi:tRNA nucleotidyltransferase (CCA-adding enzyme)
MLLTRKPPMYDAIIDADAIPRDVYRCMERIREGGHCVWIVGGALRSSLLGEEPKDWDLATDAPPSRMIQLFPRVVPTGIRHGTVQVLTSLRAIEVTTVPGRGEEGISADLGRRDFTVNAMAWAFPGGTLLDPHGGRRDLSCHLLRAVGRGEDRFREDPLRALRAGRFVSTHRFAIEEQTFAALRQESFGLRRVAQERIRDEWVRLLLGDNVDGAMECMLRGGVVRETLPEILVGHRSAGPTDAPESRLQHAVRAVRVCPLRARVRIAALFHNLRAAEGTEDAVPASGVCAGDSKSSSAIADSVMVRWRSSRRDRAAVVTLVENQLPADAEIISDADLRRGMARVGRDLLDDWVALALADRRALAETFSGTPNRGSDLHQRIQELIQTRFPMSLGELAVSGSDVKRALNLLPGTEVGEVLRELHEIVLGDPSLNRRKFLMDFILKEYHK